MAGWDYKAIFKDREKRLQLIQNLRFIPDKPYLELVFWIKTGRRLNLDRPTGFNEKLQWLKLYDKHPEYTQLVDKVAVREHVRKVLGDECLIPLLGHWESFDAIPFDELPEKFVLKCSHDSGSAKVINSKSALTAEDMAGLKSFYDGRIARNPFVDGREYPYRDVKPQVIAEKLMESDYNGEFVSAGDAATAPEGGLRDYKWLCFNGEPKVMYTVTGGMLDHHEDFFDMDYNHLDMKDGYDWADQTPAKPQCFDQMREAAAKLSKGIKHVRIDFFEFEDKMYFAEYTFYNNGGFLCFTPEAWEQRLGSWIEISG